ncbi:hypothetical protein MNB_SUP05-SYMBIONT-4-511 [hydrothermal vent metagenome]|uniref:Periplasmic nitrate reductase component NapD n=1 Tax=hydrothermal vent metagenome TaxID=652676 RepID=A0A1W1E027_9ZZZZ
MKIQESINICGILVQVADNYGEKITKRINALDGVEVHGLSADNRLVVTIERDNQGDIMGVIDSFANIGGVLSTALVYQHSEEL